MEGTVKCPSCEVENPISRATCQVCHAPLRGNAPKGATSVKLPDATSKDTEQPEPPKRERKKRASTPPNMEMYSPLQKGIQSHKTASEVGLIDPPRKRRARRKAKLPTNEQYFKLEDGNLIPVEVSLKVKAIKRKQVKAEARSLIGLWSRNKSLIK